MKEYHVIKNTYNLYAIIFWLMIYRGISLTETQK